MINILVTGGAGYIGSHALRTLKQAGYGVVVYDNLSRGHREAVTGFTLIEGDTSDSAKVAAACKEYKVGAVMHFAAHSLVGESVKKPALYYENNVVGGLRLLQEVMKAGVKYFIFSSSAAVYGEPERVPIDEDHPLRPTNPYGETKVVIERALQSYERAYDLQSVSLRYFNAAGAAADGNIGEDHNPETHLIPLVLKAAQGQREKLTVFGDDYNTADGTAVRDYIHVDDLAEAHLLALDALLAGKPSAVYNLGNGSGFSVLEVIKAAEKVTGKRVPYAVGPRRAGDPAVLVASAERVKAELGWRPRYGSLEKIIETAWHWHRNHLKGYQIVSEKGIAITASSAKAVSDLIINTSGIWKDKNGINGKEIKKMREADHKRINDKL
jgi:UDP-glucose 4-epimerase